MWHCEIQTPTYLFRLLLQSGTVVPIAASGPGQAKRPTIAPTYCPTVFIIEFQQACNRQREHSHLHQVGCLGAESHQDADTGCFNGERHISGMLQVYFTVSAAKTCGKTRNI